MIAAYNLIGTIITLTARWVPTTVCLSMEHLLLLLSHCWEQVGLMIWLFFCTSGVGIKWLAVVTSIVSRVYFGFECGGSGGSFGGLG